MDTKLKADIAESAVVTRLLKEGFRILKPVGDRLPYDLGIEVGGKLLKIQIKSAWLRKGVYTVDSRRTKTNRRQMVRSRYGVDDFDFAILYIEDLDVFYVMPLRVFSSYKSGITFVEEATRQRKPRSSQYREAWDLLKKWATQSETVERNLSNSVNPGMGIPSQVRQGGRKGVETRRQAPELFSRVKV
ncbi:MAG: group I intron-associated PD-(D/E)XK endonuclease [Candidatus Omnitrophota bacterium]